MLQNAKLLSVNMMPQVKKLHAMKMYFMNKVIRMLYVFIAVYLICNSLLLNLLHLSSL